MDIHRNFRLAKAVYAMTTFFFLSWRFFLSTRTEKASAKASKATKAPELSAQGLA